MKVVNISRRCKDFPKLLRELKTQCDVNKKIYQDDGVIVTLYSKP